MSTTPVPAWAANHLQANLPPGTPVVNATMIGGRRVLANTRLGAVLVRKSFFGGVQHVLLEVPRARLHFPCSRCQTTVNVFETRGLPAVKCEACGASYRIGSDGSITDSMGVQVRVTRATAAGTGTARPTRAVDDEAPDTAGTSSGETYQHNGYWLHVRWSKNGTAQYFFAKSVSKSGTPCALPDGYEVGANSKTGLPFLRKAGGSTNGASTGGRTPAKTTKTTTKGKTTEHDYHAQCVALTSDGSQCRNSARGTSKYCSSHKGYQPPGARKVAVLLDTAPASDDGNDDRLLAVRGRSTSIIPGEQCLAITAAGAQCRNTSRSGSKYCPSHRSYQPPTARLVAARRDTLPRVANAPDTLPSVRRSSKKR